MSVVNIQQIEYPATSPTTNGFEYMAWMNTAGDPIAEYRTWDAGAWELNEGETVVSFIEIGRKEIL